MITRTFENPWSLINEPSVILFTNVNHILCAEQQAHGLESSPVMILYIVVDKMQWRKYIHYITLHLACGLLVYFGDKKVAIDGPGGKQNPI